MSLDRNSSRCDTKEWLSVAILISPILPASSPLNVLDSKMPTSSTNRAFACVMPAYTKS